MARFPWEFYPVVNRPIMGISGLALMGFGAGIAAGAIKIESFQFAGAGLLTIVAGAVLFLLSGTKPNRYFNTAFD